MKHIFLLFLICIVLCSFAYAQAESFASPRLRFSWQSGIAFECPDDICIEGGPIGFVVALKNSDDEAITLNEIDIMDKEDIIFTNLMNLNEKIKPGEQKEFQLIGNVPPPSRGSTLYYKVCFVINGQTDCEDLPRSMTVLPLSEAECASDSECQYDEYCLKYKCYKKLEKKSIGLTEYLLIGCLVLLFVIIFLLIRKKKK